MHVLVILYFHSHATQATVECLQDLAFKKRIENFEVRGEPIILPFTDTVLHLGRYFSSLSSSLSLKLNKKEKQRFSDQTFLSTMTFPFLILSFEHDGIRVLLVFLLLVIVLCSPEYVLLCLFL